MTEKKLLFSTTRYHYLAERLLAAGNFDAGKVEVKSFPDGERYQRILTDVNGCDAVLVGGTISDSDTLELYDLAISLQKYGAAELVLVIPYFGYSTMERAVKSGEVVTAKVRATLLSSIPRTGKGNKVVLMDLHAEGIPHYFEAGIRPVHLYCKPLIIEAAHRIAGNDFILASTDAGRAKWVESLANDMKVGAAFVYKRRTSGSETEITGINADVKGKTVIIYDDMIRTGGSLISAAKSYKAAGAGEIHVITTHGLFTGDAIACIKQSGVIQSLTCTDTHPNALEVKDSFLTVISTASLLVATLNTL